MRIIYLDQNKWIELARAAKHPNEFPDIYSVLEALDEQVQAGLLVVPLSASNLYETYKINNPQQRHDLAFVQATLSKGIVFRGRRRRLEEEISDVLRNAYCLTPVTRKENWFLSGVFLEAYADMDDARLAFSIPEKLVDVIRKRPEHCLYRYLSSAPNEERTYAVKQYSDGLEQLRLRIEVQRTRNKDESFPLRRKIYGVRMMIDEMDFILQVANRNELPWKTVSDMGSSAARRIVRDVPAYYIERELALRLESQSRPIEENDFRDMQSFCAVVPYADEVVAENQFTSLAEQAKLGQRYHTRIVTDLMALKENL